MRIGGQYVGIGLGDSSEEIAKIKAFMVKKFASYAGHLGEGPDFDQAMMDAVVEMQGRYNDNGALAAGKYVPGVINLETKQVMGYLSRPVIDARGVFLTVCGTGVPWWIGPDADTARAVEFKYKWRPVGYPAAPFPMGKSIGDGRAEANRIINEERTRIESYGLNLGGYSQGAVVIAEMFEYDIKPPTGTLHWVLPHIRKAVAWGNPMREKGKAWPDPGAPMAPIDSKGVTGNLMVDTPDWWRNYAHDGDMYTTVADDESAENKTAIWQIIRGSKVFAGPDSIFAQILEVLGIKKDSSQIIEAYAIFKAIWDAGMFFAKKTGPHLSYVIDPAVLYLLEDG